MARSKKVTAPPAKVYKIDYQAKANVRDMMGLYDAIYGLIENEMSDETHDALWAVAKRIEYKQDPSSWGYRPRVTLKQLAIASSYVADHW